MNPVTITDEEFARIGAEGLIPKEPRTVVMSPRALRFMWEAFWPETRQFRRLRRRLYKNVKAL
jgi:hypothetical protein